MRLILIDPRKLRRALAAAGRRELRQRRRHHTRRGTWTGVIFGDVASSDGTNGASLAGRDPALCRLRLGLDVVVTSRKGQSKTVTVTATTPGSPGDTSGSIVLRSTSAWRHDHIPVTLRSRSVHGGQRLLQGRADRRQRPPDGEGQVDYYEFNVGRDTTSPPMSPDQRRRRSGRRLPDQPRRHRPRLRAELLNGTALADGVRRQPGPGHLDAHRRLRRAGRGRRGLPSRSPALRFNAVRVSARAARQQARSWRRVRR